MWLDSGLARTGRLQGAVQRDLVDSIIMQAGLFLLLRASYKVSTMHWAEVVKDASLRNLPYKIELNAYGQILMTPHWPIHSEIQSVLQDEQSRRLEGGRAVQE